MTTYGRINGLRFETIAAMDLFVDPTGGLDTNPGTQALPLQTLAEAETRVPYLIQHPVTIHMLSDNYVVAPWRPRAFNQALYFKADDVWDPTVFTTIIAAQAAQAGTTANAVVSGGGLVADEHFDNGDWIEFTSGAAIGQRRAVQSNDATTLVPIVRFSPAPAPGDTFVVKRSDACNALFTTGANRIIQFFAGAGRPMVPQASFQDVYQGFTFSGINCIGDVDDAVGGAGFVAAAFAFFGCRKSYSGAPGAGNGWGWRFSEANIGAGCSPDSLAAAPTFMTQAPFGLATSEHWFGWGLQQAPSDRAPMIAPAGGTKTTLHLTGSKFSAGGAVTEFSQNSILGRLKGRAGDVDSPLNVLTNATLRTRAVSAAIPVRIDAIENRHAIDIGASFAIKSNLLLPGGAQCTLRETAITSVNGDLLHAEGPSAVRMINSVTGDATGTGLAVRAQFGAHVVLTGAPVLGDAAALDYSVGNGADQNKAFFAGVGDSMANAVDGSYITRVS